MILWENADNHADLTEKTSFSITYEQDMAVAVFVPFGVLDLCKVLLPLT